MRIIWEDFREAEGSRTEFSLRVLVGEGIYGYDEDVHKISVVIAVYKGDTGKWECSVNLNRIGQLRGARILEEAKAEGLKEAMKLVGQELHKVLLSKKQQNVQGMI